jgi:hypothetical protein
MLAELCLSYCKRAEHCLCCGKRAEHYCAAAAAALLLMLLQDYRLNWRLNTACTPDIKRLCGGLCDTSSGQPCGGVVLQCLQVRASCACQQLPAVLQPTSGSH